MTKIQPRTLKTRAKLIDAAESLVKTDGYQALRVEQVVSIAGVAKGTFFAHFPDKDALMEQLIAPKINHFLDDIEELAPPKSVEDIVTALMPAIRFMTCERYVFDVILRHSGAAAKENIGPIANCFYRMGVVTAPWLAKGPFRKDISVELLADGLGAFLIQTMALHFCALHNERAMQDQLTIYLKAWLQPVT